MRNIELEIILDEVEGSDMDESTIKEIRNLYNGSKRRENRRKNKNRHNES